MELIRLLNMLGLRTVGDSCQGHHDVENAMDGCQRSPLTVKKSEGLLLYCWLASAKKILAFG